MSTNNLKRFTSRGSPPLYLWCLAALAASACGQPLEEAGAPEVAASEQALYAPFGTKLWPGDIPVCFQPRGEKQIGTVEWNTATAQIREVVESTYETIPGVKLDFTGWGVCPNANIGTFTNGIRVTVKITGWPGCTDQEFCDADDVGSGCEPGKQCDAGAGSWRHCEPGDLYPAQGCDDNTGYPDGREGSIWYSYYGAPPGDSLKLMVLHEFAHGLGFHHEYLRNDTTFHCGQAGEGSQSGDFITEYDPSSITNGTYCNSKPVLSAMDRLGLEVAYPASFQGRKLRAHNAFTVAGGLVMREASEVTMDWFDRGLPGTALWGKSGSGSEPGGSETGRSIFLGTGGRLTMVGMTFEDFKDRTHTLTGSGLLPLHAVIRDPALHTALSLTTWRM